MAKKEKKARKAPKERKPSRPKQPDLPGMESRMYSDLHEEARKYAEIRDERMDLNEQESKLKERVKRMMHEHGLNVYRYEEVEITLEPGEEDVKVRIKKPKAEAAAA
ncbi:MAG TPA: hypothetical protein VN976_22030 [Verrucomicrobiae bacterium]|nr:hypothetical protein [Verrucomicrobiae bacterium]